MRIVQVEDFFHPTAGYQVNILSKYFVNRGHEVFIVTAEMDIIPDELTSFFGKDNIDYKDREYEALSGAKIIRVKGKKYVSGRVIYERNIFEVVNSLNPDVLYVHGNDTMISIQYIWNVKKLNFPIITDSHMLSMASKNKFAKYFHMFYRFVITPIIKKNRITVIRTQDDDFVEKELGIPLEQCPWISYGSDTLLFHPDNVKKREMRKLYGIQDDDFVAIFTGKLVESKGAMLLAETFKKKFNAQKNVVLVAVGNASGDYGQRVEAVFDESENTIIRIPTQNYSELNKFYQMSDLAVFAKQCSLSFYDVQACGLPVVSENNSINIARCSHSNGKCFEADNAEDFRKCIEMFVNLSPQEYEEYKDNSLDFILTEYDYSKKADEYLEYILQAYNNYQLEKGVKKND